MLGLADRTRIIDLFEALMRGDMAAALDELRDQYDSGADPAVVLADLAEFTHFVTRVKIVPAVADDVSLAEAERTRGRAFAAKLSMRVLSRTWQMLLKGLAEVQARRPAARRRRDGAGAHRLCGRPADARRGDPRASSNGAATAPRRRQRRRRRRAPSARRRANDRAARRTARGACSPRSSSARRRRMSARCAPNRAAAPTARASRRFEDLIALAAEKRDIQMKTALERDVRLVRCEDGTLEIALEPSARKTLVNDLSRKLAEWTGRRWMVVVSTEQGAPTLQSQAQAQGRAGARACAPIRWCRRCWRAFPAPRSSACARRERWRRRMPRRRRCDEPLPDPRRLRRDDDDDR